MSNKDNKPQVKIEHFYFHPVRNVNDEPFRIEFCWRIKAENLRHLNIELTDPTGRTLTSSSEIAGTYITDLPDVSSQYRLAATATDHKPGYAVLTVQVNEVKTQTF